MHLIGLVRVDFADRGVQGGKVAALLSMTECMIDQFLFGGLIETPETPFARFVVFSSETNEVTIQTEIMSNGILEKEKWRRSIDLVSLTVSTDLPAAIIRFVVRVLSRDEAIDLTQCHLFIRGREDRLNDQLSVGERWFCSVLRIESLLLRCTTLHSDGRKSLDNWRARNACRRYTLPFLKDVDATWLMREFHWYHSWRFSGSLSTTRERNWNRREHRARLSETRIWCVENLTLAANCCWKWGEWRSDFRRGI